MSTTQNVQIQNLVSKSNFSGFLKTGDLGGKVFRGRRQEKCGSRPPKKEDHFKKEIGITEQN